MTNMEAWYGLLFTLVLVCILSVVDDTKLIRKNLISDLKKNLKELVLDKNGRCVLLQLLHPNCSCYLSPDDFAALNSYIPSLHKSESLDCPEDKTSAEKEAENDIEEEEEDEKVKIPSGQSFELTEGGKKDPSVRRRELLVDSGLAESLVDVCIENAGELLRSNFGREVIYEVASGGADRILHPTLDEKVDALHEAIASLAAEPKPEESEEGHILENLHSSRTIRKLILDCPSLASTLWQKALEGKCEVWARGHSSKVIRAFMESSETVQEPAKRELQPLIDGGVLKVPEIS